MLPGRGGRHKGGYSHDWLAGAGPYLYTNIMAVQLGDVTGVTIVMQLDIVVQFEDCGPSP